MKEIRHYLSVLFYNYKIGIQSEMEYISYTFSWLLMIPLNVLSGYYVLKVILDQRGTINGWQLGQIAFLYGLSLFSHGFQDMFFIQTRNMDARILRGEFDRALLRPLGVFFQLCTCQFNICGLYSLIPAVAVFAYGCHLVQFQWTMGNIISIIMVVIGGTLISLAVYMITGTIAFWTKKSSFLTDMNLTIIEKMTSYPMTIYPKAITNIFTFIIPLGFISFYPVCGLLKMDSGITYRFPIPIDLPVISLLAGIIFLGIARGFFLYALRYKYESAGS